MSRLFYHVMQDNAGNLLFDVTGTMRLAGTGTLATIYGDAGLTVILPNPLTNHPSYGSFKLYLGPGYYDFYMAKSGYAFEALTNLPGGGSMANQDATDVAITGGDIALDGPLYVGGTGQFAQGVGIGTTPPVPPGNVVMTGRLSVGAQVGWGAKAEVEYNKFAEDGLVFKHLAGSDLGGHPSLLFINAGAGTVGSIATNATTTSYLTTSDARLKHAVETLTGALDLVRALRPVAFRWNADDSPGVGFLAHEVAAQVSGVITGAADAVDDAGRIVPQMIDYARLVPWLVGAVQTLAARVAVLEDALGV